MSLLLPIDQQTSHFTFSTELEGVSYSFSFRWNDRDGAWFMGIGDGSGNPLVAGIKVLLGVALLGRRPAPGLPPGNIIVIDTTDQDIDAAYEDLGRRIQLYYLTTDEIAAARAAAAAA